MLTFASTIEEMEQKPNHSELKNKLVVSKLRLCFQVLLALKEELAIIRIKRS